MQPGQFTFASGRDAAHKLLSGRQRPTAVFASNDDMALGVLAAAHRLGLNVPSELSVVGFDDSPTAALVWPPLTTVRQPVFEMARAAVEMLVAGHKADPSAVVDEDELHKVLAHELIVRDSTRAR